MMKVKKLNLGCGRDTWKGYVNLDIEKYEGVDKIHDLNKRPYPFKKNSFNVIHMKNVLEHLDDPYNAMVEIHRISKKGARIYIRVPHFSSNNAWGDIQHKRGFNSETFLNENMRDMFKVVEQKITFSHLRFFMRWFANHNSVFYEKHLAYIFPAVDLMAELRVKK